MAAADRCHAALTANPTGVTTPRVAPRRVAPEDVGAPAPHGLRVVPLEIERAGRAKDGVAGKAQVKGLMPAGKAEAAGLRHQVHERRAQSREGREGRREGPPTRGRGSPTPRLAGRGPNNPGRSPVRHEVRRRRAHVVMRRVRDVVLRGWRGVTRRKAGPRDRPPGLALDPANQARPHVELGTTAVGVRPPRSAPRDRLAERRRRGRGRKMVTGHGAPPQTSAPM